MNLNIKKKRKEKKMLEEAVKHIEETTKTQIYLGDLKIIRLAEIPINGHKEIENIAYDPEDVKKIILNLNKQTSIETYIKHRRETISKRFSDKPIIIDSQYENKSPITLNIITRGIRFTYETKPQNNLIHIEPYNLRFEQINYQEKNIHFIEFFVKTGDKSAKWAYLPFENKKTSESYKKQFMK